MVILSNVSKNHCVFVKKINWISQTLQISHPFVDFFAFYSKGVYALLNHIFSFSKKEIKTDPIFANHKKSNAKAKNISFLLIKKRDASGLYKKQ